MNNWTIAGVIGRDAQVNTIDTKNGPLSVANFTVAVRVRQNDRDGNPLTLWVDCALWGVRADALAPYLLKGGKVTVSGEAGIDSYTSRDGETVPKATMRVSDVTLQGGQQQQGGQQGGQQGQRQGRQQQQQQQQQQAQRQQRQQQAPAMSPSAASFAAEAGFGDDDIPF